MWQTVCGSSALIIHLYLWKSTSFVFWFWTPKYYTTFPCNFAAVQLSYSVVCLHSASCESCIALIRLSGVLFFSVFLIFCIDQLTELNVQVQNTTFTTGSIPIILSSVNLFSAPIFIINGETSQEKRWRGILRATYGNLVPALALWWFKWVLRL